MILVVSSPADDHARAVVSHLSRLGAPATTLDLGDFPQRMSLTLQYREASWDFALRAGGRLIRACECGCIWWRRPGNFVPHREIRRESHYQFAFNESLEAFEGLWQAIDVRWVNHPTRDQVAGRKPFQLQQAQKAGLQVPRTLITNSPSEARGFIEQHGFEKVIFKCFSATEREWRETRRLTSQELVLLDNVQYAPVIFQEYIEADVDVRVTIIGEQIFAAAIHSQESSYPADFRMDMRRTKVEALQLPADLVERLERLMAALGLVYGAIDLRRTPAGDYVFLEINPAGQWLFIEERTGQPITGAVGETLAALDTCAPDSRGAPPRSFGRG